MSREHPKPSIGVRIGNGGWVCVDGTDIPGELHLRVALNESGRLKIREMYLNPGFDLEASDLRLLPLGRIEGFLNEIAEMINQRIGLACAASGVADLVQAYGTTFGRKASGWVPDAYRAQIDPQLSSGNIRSPSLKRLHPIAEIAPRPRVTRPDTRAGFTDAFYGEVAAAYMWLVSVGLAPAPHIAEETGAPVATVHRWVGEARKRGHLAPAARGRAG